MLRAVSMLFLSFSLAYLAYLLCSPKLPLILRDHYKVHFLCYQVFLTDVIFALCSQFLLFFSFSFEMESYSVTRVECSGVISVHRHLHPTFKQFSCLGLPSNWVNRHSLPCLTTFCDFSRDRVLPCWPSCSWTPDLMICSPWAPKVLRL